ncbi:MAG: hypothetical protein ACYSUP_00225 [Planctomycetota bacterium]|jgi:hypothetical protein
MFKRKKKPPTQVWVMCKVCGGDAIHGVFRRGTKTGIAPSDVNLYWGDLEYYCPTKGRYCPVVDGEKVVLLKPKK